MKRYRVQIAGPARDHVRAISDWWRENRQQSPGLFREELTGAMTLLRAFPYAGPPHVSPVHSDVRRTLLRRTQHYVYYVVDEAERLVTIVAIWHTARGAPPPL